MGKASHRPIRVRNSKRSSSLCQLGRQGPKSGPARCIQRAVVLQASMGLSTSVSHATSAVCAQPSNRQVHCGESSMGERTLEGRPQSPGAEPTIYNSPAEECSDRHVHRPSTSADREPVIGGLADSGWSSLLSDWPPSLASLVESSWRKSTLKTYKYAWVKWISWCKDNIINCKSPSADTVAKYLAYLYRTEGLNYSTILVHKSVVTNFANPLGAESLSSHPLIRQILRGISNESNLRSKTIKPPVWNPQVVVDWLLHNDPKTDNLFDISRRCAILLLLASGRRVHDLTLLSISQDHVEVEEHSITFWPEYGSKTDSLRHRQSGWLLSTSPHPNLDPVRLLKALLELSTPRRSPGPIRSLFVATRGVPRPASRTVIGGWVRTLLLDAGINDTPGSTRAAVASLNWLEQHPLDNILARGNWTSENTLARFYRRPVARQPSTGIPSVASTFRPI